MTVSDWGALANRLVAALDLEVPPISISFCETVPAGVEPFDDPMSAPSSDGRQGRVPAGCVFWMRATDRPFATVPADHGNCTVGSITHGLLDPADAAGREDVAQLVDTGWVGPDVLGVLPRVTERPGSIVYAPLGAGPVDPDVVLLRVDARQLMVLSDAWPELTVQGKPQCGIVALAKEQGAVAASFGCALSRQRTGMRPDELTCALPGGRLAAVVDALDRAVAIDGAVASYAGEDACRFG